jgi:two-component system, LytTR family, response regulator
VSIKCLIVEDEPLARNLLKDYVDKIPSLQLIKTCSNALEAMEVLNNQFVDLLFLDIQMPEITGVSFFKALSKKPLVVFTTAYSEYALEGYELDVVDYLLKPITFERFVKAVDKASQRMPKTSTQTSITDTVSSDKFPDFVFVKDGTKLVKVKLDDILYIEGMKDYVTIYTGQQKISSLQRMKAMEDQLPRDKFIRIHHSYIINIAAVESIHKNEVKIGNSLLPVSESYRKDFRDFVDSRQMQ